MDAEEKINKLIHQCLEKDKFIQRLGNVLKGCRCGIVSSTLLDELCGTKPDAEKEEYENLLAPLIQTHSRLRIQGSTLSGDKFTGQMLSLPLTTTTSSSTWAGLGALGAVSSHILAKEDEQQNRTIDAFQGVEPQFEHVEPQQRDFANREDPLQENFVTRGLDETRFTEEENLTTPSHFMSQVIIPHNSQLHANVNEGYDGESLQTIDEEQLSSGDVAATRFSGQIVNSQFPAPLQRSEQIQQSENQFSRQSSTEARNLFSNLTEYAYQTLVENVQYSVPTGEEPHSEMYSLQSPVIPLPMSEVTVQQVAVEECDQSSGEKSEGGSNQSKKEILKTIYRQPQKLKSDQSFKHRCDVCGKGFAKPSKLNEHVRVHTGEKPYKCDICHKGFAQSGTLKYHMRIHSGMKPFKCDVCGKMFTQPGQLSSHQLIHQEKKFKCQLCTKSFYYESLLERHVKIHKKQRPHRCEKCGKSFLHSGNLVIHMAKCIPDEDDLKCKDCGEIMNSKDLLHDHEELHSKDKPHQCDVCNKRFKSPMRLKKHRSSHVEVKKETSHMCDICGQCYNKPSLLKTHMRVHTGEKPFMCDLCGKFLGSANNLRRHVASHTGERNFKCTDCGKTFASAHNLEYHSRVHSGLKPFKCEHCGKCFPFSFSLDRHMRTHKKIK